MEMISAWPLNAYMYPVCAWLHKLMIYQFKEYSISHLSLAQHQLASATKLAIPYICISSSTKPHDIQLAVEQKAV